MKDIIILIPALNPPKSILSNYISNLKKNGFERILLVDDGCSEDYEKYFDKVKDKGVDIFKHYKNFGKGRALKNSFNYILNTYKDFSYVITVDSDGQHDISDIVNISKIISQRGKDKLYLGSRNFNQNNVPFKSSFGNKTTSFVYKIMFGDKINDTQTGLRAISKKHIKYFLDLEGERFEYEINMLIYSSKNNIEIEEIPIKTVYLDNNKNTHFNPIEDSFKIYLLIFKTFFKFTLSSISSWLVDICVYTLLTKVLKNMFVSFSPVIWISTLIARIVSGIFNYSINKNLVFKDNNRDIHIFYKYVLLWLVQLILSAFLVDKFFYMINIDSSFIKTIVDSLIFLISYRIQEKYIFN